MTCDCFPPRGEGDTCTCPGCWACAGHVPACTCDIAWDCEHEPGDGRRLKVMEAHLAADCPDRDNCWAAAIHDEHAIAAVVASVGEAE